MLEFLNDPANAYIGTLLYVVPTFLVGSYFAYKGLRMPKDEDT